MGLVVAENSGHLIRCIIGIDVEPVNRSSGDVICRVGLNSQRILRVGSRERDQGEEGHKGEANVRSHDLKRLFHPKYTTRR